MIVARKLRNSVAIQANKNIQISDEQVPLVQDLNSSLLALQLVALEGIEQPDPVIGKETLLNVLDIAESFASKLDVVMSQRSELLLDDSFNEELNGTDTKEIIPEIDAKILDEVNQKNENELENKDVQKDAEIPGLAESGETTVLISREEELDDNNIEVSAECIKPGDNVTTAAVPAEVLKSVEAPSEKQINQEISSTARNDVIESLLMDTAKTIMIPVVGDVLKEELPTTFESKNENIVTTFETETDQSAKENVLEEIEDQQINGEKVNQCVQVLDATSDSTQLTGK